MNQYLWMNWTYHYRQTAMDCRALNLDPKIYVAHYIKGEFIIILYILRTGLDRLLLHVWPGFFCQIVHESVFLHLALHLVHSSSGVSKASTIVRVSCGFLCGYNYWLMWNKMSATSLIQGISVAGMVMMWVFGVLEGFRIN